MIPPVFKVDELKGKNAFHNLFGIWIERDLEHFDAILAQERFEWWFLRKWNALTIGPIIAAAYLIGGDAGIMLGCIGSVAAYFGVYSFGPLKRHMEIVGHTIEWLIATERNGADKYAYLDQEVRSLAGYRQFKGWTHTRIRNAMLDAEPIARKYV